MLAHGRTLNASSPLRSFSACSRVGADVVAPMAETVGRKAEPTTTARNQTAQAIGVELAKGGACDLETALRALRGLGATNFP